jgi:hypothetical protein
MAEPPGRTDNLIVYIVNLVVYPVHPGDNERVRRSGFTLLLAGAFRELIDNLHAELGKHGHGHRAMWRVIYQDSSGGITELWKRAEDLDAPTIGELYGPQGRLSIRGPQAQHMLIEVR